MLRCLLLTLSISWAGLSPAQAAKKPPYDYYLTGNGGDTVVAAPATSTTLLMGGGPDVDAGFQWMITKAGGGDFVVIRASGADGYNPYIYAMGGVDSVETLVLPSREAANDSFVVDRVSKAEALFIAGGDQSDYILNWKGTALEAAIQGLIARHAPIGGTSAGLAVLGEVDYAALNGSVTSANALANPFNRRMTLDRGFLTAPSLESAITDAHLDSRDRMGRLVTFLARMAQDGWVSFPRGIGVDVETALAIEDGVATRLGVGSVYFLLGPGAPQVCQPRLPLTYHGVQVQRLSGGGHFDLMQWQGDGSTTDYQLDAEAGVLSSTQPGGGIY
ncbi:cyanophycinase [Ideonella sp. YS5]|uniref:cyanophycinase n=1 Tax=Ideonella sp. YS5 TaxID=3453714 RepID=UPI003EEA12E0